MISGWAFCNFICERFDFYPKREQKRTAAYYLRSKITVLSWQITVIRIPNRNGDLAVNPLV